MSFELTQEETTTTGPGISRGRLQSQIRELLAAEHRSLNRQDCELDPEHREMLRTERHRVEAKLEHLEAGAPPAQDGPGLFDEETT